MSNNDDLELLQRMCPESPGFIKAVSEMLKVIKHFAPVTDPDAVMNTGIRLKFSELYAIAATMVEMYKKLEAAEKENEMMWEKYKKHIDRLVDAKEADDASV